MYDFSNASIYILTNNRDDKFYIGSTIYSIESRLEYHTGAKVSSWNTPRSSPLYLHFNPIGWHNVTATLLEKVNCVSRDHLHIYETKYILPHINNSNCLNVRIPFSYHNYCFSKCAILNSSVDHLYNQFLHYKKFKPALRELLKLTKLYPTDYIYGRAKYLFQFVLEDLLEVVDFIPPTCSAEATAVPIIPVTNQHKKLGRPRKHPLPEPSITLPPKKRGRPRKNPLPNPPPPEPLPDPSITHTPQKKGRPRKDKDTQPSENTPVTQQTLNPTVTMPSNPSSNPRPKFSKKVSKINADSVAPLTLFISANSV
jgi:predicted GIY-YIG superfamily endonuclease